MFGEDQGKQNQPLIGWTIRFLLLLTHQLTCTYGVAGISNQNQEVRFLTCYPHPTEEKLMLISRIGLKKIQNNLQEPFVELLKI